MTVRGWDEQGGEPSRWVAGDPAAAELVAAMGPSVLPRPMTAAESARLGERVALLARTGRLPGHGRSALKTGAVATGVGLAGLAIFWGAHHVSSRPPAPVGVAVTAPHATAGAPSGEAPAFHGPSAAPTVHEVAVAVAVQEPGPAAREGELPHKGPASSARHGSAAHAGHHARASAAPGDDEDALALETRLLDEARESLVESPGRALGVLAEHRRRFPDGQLAAEREFMSIDALVRVGRLEEARKRADALRLAHPQSSYVARAARLLDRR